MDNIVNNVLGTHYQWQVVKDLAKAIPKRKGMDEKEELQNKTILMKLQTVPKPNADKSSVF